MSIALIRTVILYLATVFAVRCMGKRQLGELEPTELVITLLISDLATVCMQDLEIPLVYSLIPMATLVILEVLFSFLTMKVPLIGRLLGGRYSVLIDDGRIDQGEMRRSHITVGELMEELRQNGILSVEDVKYCVLENDGKISVIPRKEVGERSLPLILISDGVPVTENLNRRGLNRSDLEKILKKQGNHPIKSVFLLYDIDGKYTCIPKENSR